METNLSARVRALTPSVTLSITAKAKELRSQGVDVISLSAGEPDFDTPEFIKKAALDALENGQTRYTPAVGLPELREAVCRKLKRDQGLDYNASGIVVSCGAKHSLFNVIMALVEEGAEVLIPSPYWLSYSEMVLMAGGKSVFVPTVQEQGFKLNPSDLASAITPATRVLILNSPSNPTGAVYTRQDLEALAEVLNAHPDITVISDEIYEKLIFDGNKHVSIAEISPEMDRRTVIVNGMSKAYAMTGWRLGYAAMRDQALVKAISGLQSHSTSNPTSFAQAGGIAALDNGDTAAAEMNQAFQKRRDWFYQRLEGIRGIRPFKPEGAFYMFADISELGLDSLELAKRLLEEVHLAVIPGTPFGSDRHIRMSFATSESQLEKAVTRLEEWTSSRLKEISSASTS